MISTHLSNAIKNCGINFPFINTKTKFYTRYRGLGDIKKRIEDIEICCFIAKYN